MIFLAPMQSLTDLPFRLAFERVFPHTIEFAVSPFISLTHGTIDFKNPKFKDVLPEANRLAIPLIPQILGNEHDLFVNTANALYDLGYERVNWNLGCPMPRVSKKRRGSGLLPYPQFIESFLEYVLPNIKCKLSLKMRLGMYSPEEIFSLLPIINHKELEYIIMHPRIGTQLYEGDLHWNFFKEFYREAKQKIIFNGNIFELKDSQYIQTHFPELKDIMLGRGVLQNPNLANEIKENSLPENRNEIFPIFESALFEEICKTSKTDLGKLSRMKEYWTYFAKNRENLQGLFNKILRTNSLKEYETIKKEELARVLL